MRIMYNGNGIIQYEDSRRKGKNRKRRRVVMAVGDRTERVLSSWLRARTTVVLFGASDCVCPGTVPTFKFISDFRFKPKTWMIVPVVDILR